MTSGLALFVSNSHRSVMGVSAGKSHPTWCFTLEQGALRPYIESADFRQRLAGTKLGKKFYTQKAFFEQTDQIVLGFLLQYASQSGRQLFIVPCSGHYKDGTLQKEQAYFNGLFGRSFYVSKWCWLGSGYDATDSAEIVVSIDSTLPYKSAARGNRTAFSPIRSTLLGIPSLTYGRPEALPDEGAY